MKRIAPLNIFLLYELPVMRFMIRVVLSTKSEYVTLFPRLTCVSWACCCLNREKLIYVFPVTIIFYSSHSLRKVSERNKSLILFFLTVVYLETNSKWRFDELLSFRVFIANYFFWNRKIERRHVCSEFLLLLCLLFDFNPLPSEDDKPD